MEMKKKICLLLIFIFLLSNFSFADDSKDMILISHKLQEKYGLFSSLINQEHFGGVARATGYREFEANNPIKFNFGKINRGETKVIVLEFYYNQLEEEIYFISSLKPTISENDKALLIEAFKNLKESDDLYVREELRFTYNDNVVELATLELKSSELIGMKTGDSPWLVEEIIESTTYISNSMEKYGQSLDNTVYQKIYKKRNPDFSFSYGYNESVFSFHPKYSVYGVTYIMVRGAFRSAYYSIFLICFFMGLMKGMIKLGRSRIELLETVMRIVSSLIIIYYYFHIVDSVLGIKDAFFLNMTNTPDFSFLDLVKKQALLPTADIMDAILYAAAVFVSFLYNITYFFMTVLGFIFVFLLGGEIAAVPLTGFKPVSKSVTILMGIIVLPFVDVLIFNLFALFFITTGIGLIYKVLLMLSISIIRTYLLTKFGMNLGIAEKMGMAAIFGVMGAKSILSSLMKAPSSLKDALDNRKLSQHFKEKSAHEANGKSNTSSNNKETTRAKMLAKGEKRAQKFEELGNSINSQNNFDSDTIPFEDLAEERYAPGDIEHENNLNKVNSNTNAQDFGLGKETVKNNTTSESFSPGTVRKKFLNDAFLHNPEVRLSNMEKAILYKRKSRKALLNGLLTPALTTGAALTTFMATSLGGPKVALAASAAGAFIGEKAGNAIAELDGVRFYAPNMKELASKSWQGVLNGKERLKSYFEKEIEPEQQLMLESPAEIMQLGKPYVAGALPKPEAILMGKSPQLKSPAESQDSQELIDTRDNIKESEIELPDVDVESDAPRLDKNMNTNQNTISKETRQKVNVSNQNSQNGTNRTHRSQKVNVAVISELFNSKPQQRIIEEYSSIEPQLSMSLGELYDERYKEQAEIRIYNEQIQGFGGVIQSEDLRNSLVNRIRETEIPKDKEIFVKNALTDVRTTFVSARQLELFTKDNNLNKNEVSQAAKIAGNVLIERGLELKSRIQSEEIIPVIKRSIMRSQGSV